MNAQKASWVTGVLVMWMWMPRTTIIIMMKHHELINRLFHPITSLPAPVWNLPYWSPYVSHFSSTQNSFYRILNFFPLSFPPSALLPSPPPVLPPPLGWLPVGAPPPPAQLLEPRAQQQGGPIPYCTVILGTVADIIIDIIIESIMNGIVFITIAKFCWPLVVI